MAVANTLAYYAGMEMTKKQSFVGGAKEEKK
jgi:hypothetical protein